MSLRLAGLAAAIALSWPLAATGQELGPPLVKAATPCAVGEAIAAFWMQQGHGAQRIFDDRPVAGDRSNVGASVDVSAKLFAKWRAAPAAGLLQACPGARKAVEAFGPTATEEDRLRASGIGHGPYLVRIGAPMANRTDLIIDVSSHCGGLCGYGGVLHYRKTPQGWVRMEPLAIVMG